MNGIRNAMATRAAAAGIMLTVMIGASGCNTVGYVTQIFVPTGIPAVYEMPDRPTAVLIDDPSGALPDTSILQLIEGQVGQELIEHEVVESVTAQRLLSELRHNHDDFSQWPIDKIGLRVGAEQVVYVLVEQFHLMDERRTYRPTARMRVKVVDAASGRRLFPPGEPSGAAVNSEMFFKQQLTGGTEGTRQVVARRLGELAAEDVAKLFYKHYPREPGSGFED